MRLPRRVLAVRWLLAVDGQGHSCAGLLVTPDRRSGFSCGPTPAYLYLHRCANSSWHCLPFLRLPACFHRCCWQPRSSSAIHYLLNLWTL